MSRAISRLRRSTEFWLWTVFAAVLVGVDFLLWWLSGRVATADRPAFVGVASAWGVAVVGLGTGLLAAKRAGHYAQIASLQNERRAVYARLVLICDRFDDSYKVLMDAKSAVGRDPMPPDATSKLDAAGKAHEELFEEFRSARALALLVASPKVEVQLQKVLCAFKEPREQPMKSVRDTFLSAVSDELLRARKPGL